MTRRTRIVVNYPRQPPARRRRCPDCRRWTLVGYDGNVAALLIAVDPVALDPVGEMVALLAGCRTVELAPDGRLHRRGVRQIAAGRRRPVLARHRCDRTNTGEPVPPKTATPRVVIPRDIPPPF